MLYKKYFFYLKKINSNRAQTTIFQILRAIGSYVPGKTLRYRMVRNLAGSRFVSARQKDKLPYLPLSVIRNRSTKAHRLMCVGKYQFMDVNIDVAALMHKRIIPSTSSKPY